MNLPETGTVSYKHYRDSSGRLVATLCTLTEEFTENVGLGLAICSDYDNFSRSEGRKLSLHRAEIAFRSGRCTLPIRMRPGFLNINEALTNSDLIQRIKFPFKSIFVPSPISIEPRMNITRLLREGGC